MWMSGGPAARRREQAYSEGFEAGWGRNWIMELTRDG
jgi:hypothetical protein